MNLLIDFIPFQFANGLGGAASFAKAVTDAISQKRDKEDLIYAAYDSTMPEGKRYHCEEIAKEYSFTLIDLSKTPLHTAISEHAIDVLFICIGQFYERYDLSGITCKTVMFIHDIFDVERLNNQIDAAIYDKHVDNGWIQIKRYLNLYSGRWKKQVDKCYKHIMPLYNAPNTIACTVSDYSRHSLKYFFPELKKDIQVFYSPSKQTNICPDISNPELKDLISSGCDYFLFLAANRRYKNPKLVIQVFERLQHEHPSLKLLTLGYGKSISKQHIDINYVSDSDLEHAYQHARALIFASFFEGFGYPPIEAMKYGTPVLVSNVTSIPEIVGNAGYYFSPIYPADLYRTAKRILQGDTPSKELLLKHYEQVKNRQDKDLEALVNILYNPAL